MNRQILVTQFCNNKLQENLFNNCRSVEKTVTETNRHICLFPNFLANVQTSVPNATQACIYHRTQAP